MTTTGLEECRGRPVAGIFCPRTSRLTAVPAAQEFPTPPEPLEDENSGELVLIVQVRDGLAARVILMRSCTGLHAPVRVCTDAQEAHVTKDALFHASASHG